MYDEGGAGPWPVVISVPREFASLQILQILQITRSSDCIRPFLLP
jgi:hypothetical protein